MPTASDTAAVIPRSAYGAFLHLGTEVCLIASDYRYDLLNVLPDDLFQHNGTDFAAGILGIPIIEPVLNACHVAVGAVGIDGDEVVVDGNIPHAILRKRVVDIKPCQRGITTES